VPLPPPTLPVVGIRRLPPTIVPPDFARPDVPRTPDQPLVLRTTPDQRPQRLVPDRVISTERPARPSDDLAMLQAPVTLAPIDGKTLVAATLPPPPLDAKLDVQQPLLPKPSNDLAVLVEKMPAAPRLDDAPARVEAARPVRVLDLLEAPPLPSGAPLSTPEVALLQLIEDNDAPLGDSLRHAPPLPPLPPPVYGDY
jgi:hypothetical protein